MERGREMRQDKIRYRNPDERIKDLEIEKQKNPPTKKSSSLLQNFNTSKLRGLG